MKKKTVTRAKAQRTIASTTDLDVIKPFLQHENVHIKRYAEHKIRQLLEPTAEEPVEEPVEEPAPETLESPETTNHGHVLSTGKPVDHECYVLPAAAVRAEHRGNIQLAQQLIAEAKPLKHHNGVRQRDVGRAHKAGAKDWVAFRTDSYPNIMNWVAQLPGDGGVDWGYTSDHKQHLLMTAAQARRFKAYMCKLGKEQQAVIIQLSAVVSWRPEMFIPGDGWIPNGLRFATRQEALDSASDLFGRWAQPTGYRAMPSRELVNYKREDGKDVRIDAIGQIYG